MKSRILIVEDETDLRCNIVDILDNQGYETYQASEGKTALEFLINNDVDLVISDIMMPKMNGLELIKTLKENNIKNDVPFIFLTALSEYDDLRKGMRFGADDYLFKPFNTRDLLDAVKMRLKKSSETRKRVSEIINQLTKNIPHELRTPLTPLIGYSDMLLDDFNQLDEHTILDFLKSVNVSSKRLRETVNKFILHSELTIFKKNKEEVQKSLSCIKTWKRIQKIADQLAKQYHRKKDIFLNLQETNLTTDDHNFDFIVTELITNAIKFSEPDSKIYITTYEENNEFVFEVADSGLGLTKEQISGIGPFVQFNKEIYQQNGLGLGLAIIKLLIEPENGTIEIISNPQQETKVKITLKNTTEVTNELV